MSENLATEKFGISDELRDIIKREKLREKIQDLKEKLEDTDLVSLNKRSKSIPVSGK